MKGDSSKASIKALVNRLPIKPKPDSRELEALKSKVKILYKPDPDDPGGKYFRWGKDGKAEHLTQEEVQTQGENDRKLYQEHGLAYNNEFSTDPENT